VAHEALLTAWGRLREWIDEARDDLRQHRRIARWAVEWRASGRDRSFLITGSRLDAAEAWAAGASLALGADEREYLKASLDCRNETRVADALRRDREAAVERRSRTRLRALVAVLTGAMVIAGVLTVIALRNSSQAKHEATIATARELAAAALGSLQSDPERSLLLALEAVETTSRSGETALPEAQEALHQAVIGSRVVRSFDANGGSAALSVDGVLAVRSANAPGSVELRDVATGRMIRTLRAHDRPVGDLTFSADGGLLATTSGDGRLRVWNTESGRLVAEVRRHGEAGSPSFSGDGQRVAASWDDETAVVMSTASGRVVRALRGVGWSHPIDLSPDGSRVVYSHGSGAVIASVDARNRVVPLVGEYPANDVAWSPDGGRVAVVSNGGAGEIWDARTGRRRLILPHRGIILAVAWAPDSSHLITGALDGTARVWETHAADVTEVARLSAEDTSSGIDRVGFSASGEQAFSVDAERSAVKLWAVGRAGDAEWANLPAAAFLGDVEFLPDGRLAASVGDGAVGVWNRELTRRIDVVAPELDGWPWFDVSPDGKWLAVGGNHVTLWDVTTGAALIGARALPAADEVGWSPDGRYVVAPRDDHSIGVVDRTGRVVRVLPVPPTLKGYSPAVALFSPDGDFVAGAVHREDVLGAVILWDWRSGDVVRTIDVYATAIAFAPDGSRIAVVEPRAGGAIYDLGSGRRVAALHGHTSAVIDIEFSPDGSRVATAGFSDAVRLFDADDGTPLLVLHSPEAAVSNIGFSADGRRLAAFSPDVGGDGIGTVRVWALDVADLVRIARSKATRGFTEDECRRFLHQEHCHA
jgi:WD40 repeat protein